jgi:hypothetical protein
MELKKFLKANKIRNITYHNLWEKHSIKQKVYNSGCLHQKKRQRFQINNLTMHFKHLEKQE